MSIKYNLPDVGSQEWYSSPLYPAVADLDRRIGVGTDTSTSLAAQIAALQTSVTTAQTSANTAQTSANNAQTSANNAQTSANAAQTTANAANAVKPYWFGYLATSQSTSGTWPTNTLISWTQDSSNGGFFYSAGIVTLPSVAGRYRITAQLYFDASITGGVRLCQVYSGSTGGGSIVTASSMNPAWSAKPVTGIAVTAIKTLQLTAGYQMRVLAAQDAGGTLSVLAGTNQTYFQVEYLGAN